MTTIATDGNIVAYDSRSSLDHGTIVSDTKDKCRIIDGVYYIGCGADSDIQRLIEKYIEGATSETQYQCDVFMSDGDGKLYRIDVDDEGSFKYDISDIGNAAIGSGCDYALAAMDFGKSPIQAVRYAMTRDKGTGGKVRSFKLKR